MRKRGFIVCDHDEYATPKGSLIDFFLKAPFPEVHIDISRSDDLPRDIDLDLKDS